ncbi:UNVERIFIED_CONTAM: hypothetical protein NCL1_02119 [Trichonephila clavipes]
MCTNCSSEPAHILECLGLTKQDIADVLLLVLDSLKMYIRHMAHPYFYEEIRQDSSVYSTGFMNDPLCNSNVALLKVLVEIALHLLEIFKRLEYRKEKCMVSSSLQAYPFP